MPKSKVEATRRDALKSVGGLGTAALFGWACSDDSGTGGEGGAGGDGQAGHAPTGGAGGTNEGGSGGIGGGSAGSPATGGEGGEGGGNPTNEWATEGTSVMEGKDYGNPFEGGIGPTCNVYPSCTKGPCHAPSPVRRDVSEGHPGLPMRLELLIVDTECNPVPGAIVEIWHTDTFGVYSGDIDGVAADDFCTGGDPIAAAASWYRGTQTSGDDGRITFDTNFPGWYQNRANHIHFQVTVGATVYKVSQLFFDEALNEEIYDTQPSYRSTNLSGYQPNQGDGVIQDAGLELEEVVVSHERQSDGALLAWKAITIPV